MSAHHFFAGSVDGDTVTITGEDARHAARVLRIAPGETITVSDGAGAVADARCIEASERVLVATVLARRVVPEPRPRVVVYPALTKAAKLESVVQKLTEIGVAAIRPWPAARSVVRWDEAKGRARAERLRAIAREASMQSRRAWLPRVEDPAPIASLPDPSFVLHPETEERLLDALPEAAPAEIALVIGPEGGLERDEVERLARPGVTVCGLGETVLRTETASIVAASLVLGKYRLLG